MLLSIELLIKYPKRSVFYQNKKSRWKQYTWDKEEQGTKQIFSHKTNAHIFHEIMPWWNKKFQISWSDTKFCSFYDYIEI